MEELGVISPVVSISLDYKKPVLFDEVVYFVMEIEEYNGIKLEISYEIRNKKTDEVCVTAKSKHCFINENVQISSIV